MRLPLQQFARLGEDLFADSLGEFQAIQKLTAKLANGKWQVVDPGEHMLELLDYFVLGSRLGYFELLQRLEGLGTFYLRWWACPPPFSGKGFHLQSPYRDLAAALAVLWDLGAGAGA